jgi:hypothetical protein
VTHDRIQSKVNLKMKKIVDDSQCEVCDAREETTQHILFECPFARSFWAALGFRLPQDCVHSSCTSYPAPTSCQLSTMTP